MSANKKPPKGGFALCCISPFSNEFHDAPFHIGQPLTGVDLHARFLSDKIPATAKIRPMPRAHKFPMTKASMAMTTVANHKIMLADIVPPVPQRFLPDRLRMPCRCWPSTGSPHRNHIDPQESQSWKCWRSLTRWLL